MLIFIIIIKNLFFVKRFGEWIEVVVDDQLPVDSDSNTLIYCHNNVDQQEMFSPLLEKAYAVIHLQ